MHEVIVRRYLPPDAGVGDLSRLAELLQESARAVDRRRSQAQTLYDNTDESPGSPEPDTDVVSPRQEDVHR